MSIEEVGVADAKRRFSELTERVAAGESFMVVRRGKPAVALVPPQRAAEHTGAPVGFAAFAGALADWVSFEEDMSAIVAARQHSQDRPAPEL